MLAQALARIGELEAKVQELESALTKAKSEPPSFVKPNTSNPSLKTLKRSLAANEPKTKMVPDAVRWPLPKLYSTTWSSVPSATILSNTLNLPCLAR